MSLEVEGDVTQLRIDMAGKTLWFAENAQGTFVGLDGNKFATLTGKQTYVIDLEKSGVTTAVAEMHFHYTFGNVGDNIKITSLKFGKDNVVSATLPTNDDTKPVLTASVRNCHRQLLSKRQNYNRVFRNGQRQTGHSQRQQVYRNGSRHLHGESGDY